MKKKMHLHVFILILIAGVVFGVMTLIISSHNSAQRESKEFLERVVSDAMSSAGYWIDNTLTESQLESGHMLVNLTDPKMDGLSSDIFFFYDYVGLALYRKETGNVISHDQILALMSEGGCHREVTEYLSWASENRAAISDYRSRLSEIYYEYAAENEGFPLCFPHLLPIEMVDELIKKEVAPDYQMNLTSIQDGFVEEGHARLFVDGKTIRFILPRSE